MRKQNLNVDPPKFVYMTEKEFIIHFGENYEDAVKDHIIHDKPVLQIFSVNGCASAIPLERAKFMLEKYYKMTNKKAKKRVSEPEQAKKEPVEKKEVVDTIESQEIKRKQRNSSQSPEYA